MSEVGLSVIGYGMWTAAGHNGPSTSCAIQSGLIASEQAHLWDSLKGEQVSAFKVRAHQWWEGAGFLPELLLPPIEECLGQIGALPTKLRVSAAEVPILICVAPPYRPGRPDGDNVEQQILNGLARKLGRPLPPGSGLLPLGRVGLPHMLGAASRQKDQYPLQILVGVESFLQQEIVEYYNQKGRILTSTNSSGFIPGEGAAALLVARDSHVTGPALKITGMGAGQAASRDGGNKDNPVRGDGLTKAMRGALATCPCAFYDIAVQMGDMNGEHFKFKEQTLAVMRVNKAPPGDQSKRPRDHIEHWNMAETLGEIGAALLPAAMAHAFEAGCSGFLPLPDVIFHAGEDDGARVALTARFEGRM